MTITGDLITDFIKVCSINDVKLNSAKRFVVNEKEIAVFNLSGKFYAIAVHCTHAGGPLHEGYIEGNEVECPWHGAKFDITTGAALAPPAPKAVHKYEVKVQGNDVMIKD